MLLQIHVCSCISQRHPKKISNNSCTSAYLPMYRRAYLIKFLPRKPTQQQALPFSLVTSLLSLNKITAIAVSPLSVNSLITLTSRNPIMLPGTIFRPLPWIRSQEWPLLLALRPKIAHRCSFCVAVMPNFHLAR